MSIEKPIYKRRKKTLYIPKSINTPEDLAEEIKRVTAGYRNPKIMTMSYQNWYDIGPSWCIGISYEHPLTPAERKKTIEQAKKKRAEILRQLNAIEKEIPSNLLT